MHNETNSEMKDAAARKPQTAREELFQAVGIISGGKIVDEGLHLPDIYARLGGRSWLQNNKKVSTIQPEPESRPRGVEGDEKTGESVLYRHNEPTGATAPESTTKKRNSAPKFLSHRSFSIPKMITSLSAFGRISARDLTSPHLISSSPLSHPRVDDPINEEIRTAFQPYPLNAPSPSSEFCRPETQNQDHFDIFLSFTNPDFQTRAVMQELQEFKRSGFNIPLTVAVTIIINLIMAVRIYLPFKLFKSNPAFTVGFIFGILALFAVIIIMFLRILLLAKEYHVVFLEKYYLRSLAFTKSRFSHLIEDFIIIAVAIATCCFMLARVMIDQCPSYGVEYKFQVNPILFVSCSSISRLPLHLAYPIQPKPTLFLRCHTPTLSQP
jgi:hypothetical protein